MDEATTTKVNDLDLTARVRLDQNIFWLQVTVNQLQVMTKSQRFQDLLCDSLQTRDVEIDFLLNLTIVFGVLIEIIAQKLCHNEEMFLVIEEIDQF